MRRLWNRLKGIGLTLALNSMAAFVSLLLMLIGLRGLLVDLRPGEEGREVFLLLPQPAYLAWAILLILGAALSLVGLVFGQLRVERAGQVALAGGTAVYAWAIIFYLHLPQVTVWGLLPWSFVTVALALRYWALGRQ